MGDPDEVDVVDPAVVNVVLGQLGVVEGQELTEGLVVRSTDGGKLAQPFERFGHVGMGLHGEPPAPTTLSELSAACDVRQYLLRPPTGAGQTSVTVFGIRRPVGRRSRRPGSLWTVTRETC